MQRLVGQNEPGPLLRRQAVFNERQVQVFVAAIQLVANNRVAEMGEVKADLVLAAGVRSYSQEGVS